MPMAAAPFIRARKHRYLPCSRGIRPPSSMPLFSFFFFFSLNLSSPLSPALLLRRSRFSAEFRVRSGLAPTRGEMFVEINGSGVFYIVNARNNHQLEGCRGARQKKTRELLARRRNYNSEEGGLSHELPFASPSPLNNGICSKTSRPLSSLSASFKVPRTTESFENRDDIETRNKSPHRLDWIAGR